MKNAGVWQDAGVVASALPRHCGEHIVTPMP